MTPATVLHNVAERALMHAYMYDGRLNRSISKPGQFYESRVTEEEKEVLRNLTNADLQSVSRMFLCTLSEPEFSTRTTVHHFK